MDSSWIVESKNGRHFIGRLAQHADIVDAVENLCRENRIEMAVFSIRGSVTQATFGVFDQQQQVYITDQKNMPFEILACNGRFFPDQSNHQTRAWVVLADNEGALCGGRLFSETLVFEAEIEIQELLGSAPRHRYDPDTGLVLLQKHN